MPQVTLESFIALFEIRMFICVSAFLTDLFSGPKVVFYFSSKLRNWTEARSYCRERYTDLVIVTSDANNQVIKNLISSKVWIGLFRDSWKWEDGNNSSFLGANKCGFACLLEGIGLTDILTLI
uniref:C-type lectin domain-containing protein n=1 Tax=Kryptolebias marmoratus TaxID=37003 RepID=A0A3Q3BE43_KRYMA